ncbi:Hypothetical protein FKW44_020359 [Caligus rogercresseyi]|uniref:Uncharacterized protein n=1 Tax=Caligus rogercresseyi TaxID=217165 RepID=A0A7T8GX73_CALRO|nr:Hypothetical protein FKW44_020359 [Caligus rogercresseyi]
MADSFNDPRAPTGVREDEGTSLSNTFGGRIPDSLAASQEVQDQSGEANIGSDIDACSTGRSHSSEDSGTIPPRGNQIYILCGDPHHETNENSLKMMEGMFERFLGKTLSSGSSGDYTSPYQRPP